MNDTIVMLLAGGMGSRLNVLAHRRAKPAVPFAGSYRIIDFTLSNAMAAGLGRVGVLTQYRPTSLAAHLENGVAWDLWGKDKVLRVLPPFQGEGDADWYRGTADAVWQNRDFLSRWDSKRVVVLSGDHIYRMDYAEMIRAHDARKADLTIAVMNVPWEEASRFGLLHTDDDGRVTQFEEKPANPSTNLASMGVYVFDRAALERHLDVCCPSGRYDFGKDVIPNLFEAGGRVYAHRFQGYWRDVGTIQSYWEANMDVLDPRSGIDLADWGTRTNPEADGTSEMPVAWVGGASSVSNSIISRGCVVEGTVERSVLSPGVRVAPGAVVRDSILMNGTTVAPGATLDRAVIDKSVTIGAGAQVGVGDDDLPNTAFPSHLNTGLCVVGKEASLPAECRLGRNALVFPGVGEADFGQRDIPAGGTVR